MSEKQVQKQSKRLRERRMKHALEVQRNKKRIQESKTDAPDVYEVIEELKLFGTIWKLPEMFQTLMFVFK